jgi:hypothetical protein
MQCKRELHRLPASARCVKLPCVEAPLPLLKRRQILRPTSPFCAPEGSNAHRPRLIVLLEADYANLRGLALTHRLLGFAYQHFPSHQPCLLFVDHMFHDLRTVAHAADTDDAIPIAGGGTAARYIASSHAMSVVPAFCLTIAPTNVHPVALLRCSKCRSVGA